MNEILQDVEEKWRRDLLTYMPPQELPLLLFALGLSFPYCFDDEK